MKFDYQYLEGKFLPLVPIKLKKVNEWLVLRGFVDTGASFCLFPADILELLGKNLEDGEKREMVVGDGNSLEVYLHKLLISIAGKEFETPVGFSKGLNIHLFIIGRENIFDKFVVCFHEKEHLIEFTSC